MDNLEKFIHENKDKFDPELPEGLWDKIEDKKSSKSLNRRNWIKPLSIAAGILVLVSVGTAYLMNDTGSEPKQSTVSVEEENETELTPIDLKNISPEYAEIENHYVLMVNDKLNELNELNPDPEIMKEMDELETEYELLKGELGSGGDDEQVIEAMIENYRIKLRILEDVLDHLKDIDNEDIRNIEI